MHNPISDNPSLVRHQGGQSRIYKSQNVAQRGFTVPRNVRCITGSSRVQLRTRRHRCTISTLSLILRSATGCTMHFGDQHTAKPTSFLVNTHSPVQSGHRRPNGD